MRATFALALLALTALPGRTEAATFEHPMGLGDLSDNAERAIIGEVIATWVERTPTGIWTVASVVVDETLKGPHDPVVEIRWQGGVVGNVELIVPGMPRLHVGEQLLAFVDEQGMTVGLAQGAFQISGDQAVRDMSGLDFRGEPDSDEATADTFDIDEIRAALASR